MLIEYTTSHRLTYFKTGAFIWLNYIIKVQITTTMTILTVIAIIRLSALKTFRTEHGNGNELVTWPLFQNNTALTSTG